MDKKNPKTLVDEILADYEKKMALYDSPENYIESLNKEADGEQTLKKVEKFYKKHMPETVYLLRNKERYDKIVSSMNEIQAFISSIDDEATFEISKDELIGTSLSLEIKCTLIALTEVDAFCNAIKNADSIDIVPTNDGLLSVIFGFNDAYVPAMPNKK